MSALHQSGSHQRNKRNRRKIQKEIQRGREVGEDEGRGKEVGGSGRKIHR